MSNRSTYSPARARRPASRSARRSSVTPAVERLARAGLQAYGDPRGGRAGGGVEDVGATGWPSRQRLQPQQRDLAQVVDGLGPLRRVVVAEPPVELGQDLVGVAARGADQEDAPEPRFVRRVAGRQPRRRRRRSPGPRRPARAGDCTPPRSPIRGCADSACSSSSSLERPRGLVGAGQQRRAVGVRLARPARRRPTAAPRGSRAAARVTARSREPRHGQPGLVRRRVGCRGAVADDLASISP